MRAPSTAPVASTPRIQLFLSSNPEDYLDKRHEDIEQSAVEALQKIQASSANSARSARRRAPTQGLSATRPSSRRRRTRSRPSGRGPEAAQHADRAEKAALDQEQAQPPAVPPRASTRQHRVRLQPGRRGLRRRAVPCSARRTSTAPPAVLFDCSGLTSWAYRRPASPTPDLRVAGERRHPHLQPEDLKVGDLVIFYGDYPRRPLRGVNVYHDQP